MRMGLVSALLFNIEGGRKAGLPRRIDKRLPKDDNEKKKHAEEGGEGSMRHPTVTQIAVVVLMAGLLSGQALAGPQVAAPAVKPAPAKSPPAGSAPPEEGLVQGSACYRLSDDGSLLSAQKKALALAREAALKKIKAFTEHADKLGATGLEPEVVAAASRVGLRDERITKQEVKANQVCVWLTATPNSKEVAELIRQRLNAKELAKKVQDPVIASAVSNFGLKVWTNKQAGDPFVEGERLVIFVESEKDAYLKLDYYTAEGKVVHLVPNVFTNEARIQGGEKYSFGDEGATAEFKISGPFGEEIIKALASTVPFDSALIEAGQVSETTAYLTKMQNALKDKAKDGTWASAMVAISTSNKEDLQVARDRKNIEMPPAKAGQRSLGKQPEKPEQPIDIIGVPGRKKGEKPIETMGTMGRTESGGEKNP